MKWISSSQTISDSVIIAETDRVNTGMSFLDVNNVYECEDRYGCYGTEILFGLNVITFFYYW